MRDLYKMRKFDVKRSLDEPRRKILATGKLYQIQTVRLIHIPCDGRLDDRVSSLEPTGIR